MGHPRRKASGRRQQVPHVGIDFDNTLIRYDRLFHRHALRQGLIADRTPASKRAVRDAIRALPDGNRHWTILQGEVYGKFIDEATIDRAAVRFIRACRARSVPVTVISHKTEYPAIGAKIPLREAAFGWMERNGFFDDNGLGFSRDDILFASTRGEKIRRIVDRGCTHFIDDLEEVFLDPRFPPHVDKILYAPGGDAGEGKDIRLFRSWSAIHAFVFPRR